ncbi:MAG TPA: hypothetical protein VGN21_07085, partial [Stellaceae bacterium]
MLTGVRSGEHLDGVIAAVFVHLLDPPVSRRFAILEYLGAEIFWGLTLIQHGSSLFARRMKTLREFAVGVKS